MDIKNRKATYKTPPTSLTTASESQELRRRKALDEQRRKRAQRVDSSRQLDILAHLTLGESDDEEEPTDSGTVPMEIPPHASNVVSPSGPSHFEVPTDRGKKKRKQKQKTRNSKDKPNNKWADRCMYAELLEMSEDAVQDGLPEDLETGWVAVAPVPVGKRCLAVTDHLLGTAGLVPNTSLRSRKSGKFLMPRFPSNLPPSTVLDCILDENWRESGILHVLDVLKWKGQDIGDCETPFRFWWRDTRLEELPTSPPPSNSNADGNDNVYRFPYPNRFVAIPHHTDTSLLSLASQIVPLARASRSIIVDIPTIGPTDSDSMVIDQMQLRNQTIATTIEVRADGLLLYVAEASYESGTSPLSSWVPIAKYQDGQTPDDMIDDSTGGPLDVFQRLVVRRLSLT